MRSFKKLVSKGPFGTAAKIIIKIVHEWMLRNNNKNYPFEIEQMSSIINNLAKAIENKVNYSLYQKQSTQIKDGIKLILSRDLGEFVKKKGDAFQQLGNSELKNKTVPHFGKTKSLNEIVSVVKENPAKFYIIFPDNPFKFVNELEVRIVETLKDKYIYLLINQDEDNNNLKTSQLLSKKILNQPPFPAEKILDEMIRRWKIDNPHHRHDEIKTKDYDILKATLHSACAKVINLKYYKKQSDDYKKQIFELLVVHLILIAKTANLELIKNCDHSRVTKTGIQYVDGNIHQDHQFTSLASLQGNSPIWIKFPDLPFYGEAELCAAISQILYSKHESLLNPSAVRAISKQLPQPVFKDTDAEKDKEQSQDVALVNLRK